MPHFDLCFKKIKINSILTLIFILFLETHNATLMRNIKIFIKLQNNTNFQAFFIFKSF
jgi:hypothetical protein